MTNCACIVHVEYPGITLPPPSQGTTCDGCGSAASLAVAWNKQWSSFRVSPLGPVDRVLNYCERCAEGVVPRGFDQQEWTDAEGDECAGCGYDLIPAWSSGVYCLSCSDLNDEVWSISE